MPRKKKEKKEDGTTYEKPISLYPLTPYEAIEALLKTKPMPKDKEKPKSPKAKNQENNASSENEK